MTLSERAKEAKKELSVLADHVNTEINRISEKYQMGCEIKLNDSRVLDQQPLIIVEPIGNQKIAIGILVQAALESYSGAEIQEYLELDVDK